MPVLSDHNDRFSLHLLAPFCSSFQGCRGPQTPPHRRHETAVTPMCAALLLVEALEKFKALHACSITQNPLVCKQFSRGPLPAACPAVLPLATVDSDCDRHAAIG